MPLNKNSDLFTRALLRVPVPWVFVLSYLVGVGLEKLIFQHVHLTDSTDSMFVTVTGAIAFALGAAFAAWGWGNFRQVKTTRVPGEISATLVTWGPYRFARNPMYVGLAVAYVGETGLLHQLLPLFLLPLTVGYLDRVVIPLEEKKLCEVFGAEYERYCNRVRRWLCTPIIESCGPSRGCECKVRFAEDLSSVRPFLGPLHSPARPLTDRSSRTIPSRSDDTH